MSIPHNTYIHFKWLIFRKVQQATSLKRFPAPTNLPLFSPTLSLWIHTPPTTLTVNSYLLRLATFPFRSRRWICGASNVLHYALSVDYKRRKWPPSITKKEFNWWYGHPQYSFKELTEWELRTKTTFFSSHTRYSQANWNYLYQYSLID